MMLTKILIFAWTFGIINQKTTPVLIDCLTRVQKCPIGKEAWAIKNDRYRCKGSETYVCIQDSNRNLYEGCMSNFTIQANSGNCPVLIVCVKNKPYLGLKESYFPCPEEDPGCPAKSHPEYSIQELYKYPRCSGSQVFLNTSRTRQDSTTSGFNSTKDHVQGQGHTYIIVILVVIPVIIVCSMIGCFLVYKRCIARTNENYAAVIFRDILDTESVSLRPSERLELRNTARHQEYSQATSLNDQNETETNPNDYLNRRTHETDYGKLQELICDINESEADKIKVLQHSNANETTEIDNIYVQMLIVDEHGGINDEGKKPYITEDMIFKRREGKDNARYIFMLGEAGYGKTMQCQRFAKSWCKQLTNGKKDLHANYHQLTNLEKRLKKFDFLFFVKMRDVKKEDISLIDMIQDVYSRYHLSERDLNGITTILKGSIFKSIVLLDGLDEWEISDDEKPKLLDKCIPNCRDMPNCTILISMRSWKFLKVENEVCRHKVDRVIRLHGLNENAIIELTNKMLDNHFKTNIDYSKLEEEEIKRKHANILSRVSSPTFELKSLMKNPLLAVFCILTISQEVDIGHSLTTLYFSIIEALIKRYSEKRKKEIKETVEIHTEACISWKWKEYELLSTYLRTFCKLGEIAFKSIINESNSSVFTQRQLNEQLSSQELDLFLNIGIVTKQVTFKTICEDNVRLTFLHKSIQEFFSSLYLSQEKGESEIMNSVSDAVVDIEKALQWSNILTYLSGLSPEVGCKISGLIRELASKDRDILSYREYYDAESYQKVFYLYHLQLRCYKEVRGPDSIIEFEERELKPKFEFSDIILLAKDTEASIVRDSAKLLQFHADDIVSLNIVCIPDNIENGITNDEIKKFLDESHSIKSLFIDGYVDGKCRQFDNDGLNTSCLSTLGFANVAFKNNYLNRMLTKEESKKEIHALGLIYLKSENDLTVDFKYDIPSIHWISTGRSGFIRKTSPPTDRTLPTLKTKMSFLAEFLETLPKYEVLSTFYFSFMEAGEDRLKLKEILPALKEIKTLTHIGYRGSSIYNVHGDTSDEEVISCIIEIKKLQKIHLREIDLTKDILNFTGMTDLQRIWLGMFTMDQCSHWESFLKSLSSNVNLQKVILYATNVESAVYEKYRTLPGGVDIKNIEGTDF